MHISSKGFVLLELRRREDLFCIAGIWSLEEAQNNYQIQCKDRSANAVNLWFGLKKASFLNQQNIMITQWECFSDLSLRQSNPRYSKYSVKVWKIWRHKAKNSEGFWFKQKTKRKKSSCFQWETLCFSWPASWWPLFEVAMSKSASAPLQVSHIGLQFTFKWTVSRDFLLQVFLWIIFPQAPENKIRVISKFLGISGDIRISAMIMCATHEYITSVCVHVRASSLHQILTNLEWQEKK